MFGNASEAAIVRVMRIREQLRPYVMEQYAAAAHSGTPVMRPLFFDFFDDPGSQALREHTTQRPPMLPAHCGLLAAHCSCSLRTSLCLCSCWCVLLPIANDAVPFSGC